MDVITILGFYIFKIISSPETSIESLELLDLLELLEPMFEMLCKFKYYID